MSWHDRICVSLGGPGEAAGSGSPRRPRAGTRRGQRAAHPRPPGGPTTRGVVGNARDSANARRFRPDDRKGWRQALARPSGAERQAWAQAPAPPELLRPGGSALTTRQFSEIGAGPHFAGPLRVSDLALARGPEKAGRRARPCRRDPGCACVVWHAGRRGLGRRLVRRRVTENAAFLGNRPCAGRVLALDVSRGIHLGSAADFPRATPFGIRFRPVGGPEGRAPSAPNVPRRRDATTGLPRDRREVGALVATRRPCLALGRPVFGQRFTSEVSRGTRRQRACPAADRPDDGFRQGPLSRMIAPRLRQSRWAGYTTKD
jgi:hypothetical protein